MKRTMIVLPLLAVGGAMAFATAAHAEFMGLIVENRTDAVAEAKGLFVCNIFACFDDPTDRLLSVGFSQMSTQDGSNFHQDPNFRLR